MSSKNGQVYTVYFLQPFIQSKCKTKKIFTLADEHPDCSDKFSEFCRHFRPDI